MGKHSVCFFGDETLLGLNDPEGNGWGQRVVRAERGNGHVLVPYILAVEGDTTAKIASRWGQEANARLTGLPASAIVFCFGLHDQATHLDDVQIPIQETLDLAEAMVTEASAWRTVFWVGPPPVRGSNIPMLGRSQQPLVYDNVRLRVLTQSFANIAAHNGVPYLDLCSGLDGQRRYTNALVKSNGVLPGEDGHAMIAEMLQSWMPWRDWLDRGISANLLKRI